MNSIRPALNWFKLEVGGGGAGGRLEDLGRGLRGRSRLRMSIRMTLLIQ